MTAVQAYHKVVGIQMDFKLVRRRFGDHPLESTEEPGQGPPLGLWDMPYAANAACR
jgi:hypothetical protein